MKDNGGDCTPAVEPQRLLAHDLLTGDAHLGPHEVPETARVLARLAERHSAR
jgi:hypothetical protein